MCQLLEFNLDKVWSAGEGKWRGAGPKHSPATVAPHTTTHHYRSAATPTLVFIHINCIIISANVYYMLISSPAGVLILVQNSNYWDISAVIKLEDCLFSL